MNAGKPSKCRDSLPIYCQTVNNSKTGYFVLVCALIVRHTSRHNGNSILVDRRMQEHGLSVSRQAF
jgi:hypothetical protein